MAINSEDSISYFLSLAVQHKDYLGAIRHWSNLKIAFEEDRIWVKDLTAFQVDAVEVKSIPYKEVYYLSGNRLFPKGSLLPSRNLPSLLWTPIERGLPITLPTYNHNYFGISDKVSIHLVPSHKEAEAFALMVKLDVLDTYIQTAPAIRLKNLSWVIINETYALLLGVPLLPLQGAVYWQREDFLLPAGYDLELFALYDTINSLLNEKKDAWVLWEPSGSYYTISKQACVPLSISSFRLSKV